ncbi:sodium:calcium antiporter [Candidatus Micrarchaeota archaeon]|nr:sodium:calcium antiporter [Candidatus Micrarchaeota archaeon]
MLAELGVLLISAIVLAKAADLIVENSLLLARFLNVSELAIGFLLVSVATSLPELSIAITSIFEKAPGISAGNVLGANITNITLVLGVAAIVSTVKIGKNDVWKARNILAVAVLAPFLLIFFPGWISSAILLALFAAYAFISLRQHPARSKEKPSRQNAFFALFFFAAGVVLLLVSADLVVKSAVDLAKILGFSSTIIGATLISIGTTLPELSVSLQAARKKTVSLAVGNAVGSTLVNSTLVLPIASLSTAFSLNVHFAALAVLFLAIASAVALMLRSQDLSRTKGFALLGTFVLFLAFAIALDLVV